MLIVIHRCLKPILCVNSKGHTLLNKLYQFLHHNYELYYLNISLYFSVK